MLVFAKADRTEEEGDGEHHRGSMGKVCVEWFRRDGLRKRGSGNGAAGRRTNTRRRLLFIKKQNYIASFYYVKNGNFVQSTGCKLYDKQ